MFSYNVLFINFGKQIDKDRGRDRVLPSPIDSQSPVRVQPGALEVESQELYVDFPHEWQDPTNSGQCLLLSRNNIRYLNLKQGWDSVLGILTSSDNIPSGSLTFYAKMSVPIGKKNEGSYFTTPSSQTLLFFLFPVLY